MNENDAVLPEILTFAIVTPTHADRHASLPEHVPKRSFEYDK